MNKLRKRMPGDMQLRGFADRTIEAYVHAVSGLARHFKSRIVGTVWPGTGWSRVSKLTILI